MILTKKRFHEKYPEKNEWNWQFFYYVEFIGNWEDVERFAARFIRKRDKNKIPECVEKLDIHISFKNSNFESWSGNCWSNGNQIFGCYDEELALAVNGKFGKDVI